MQKIILISILMAVFNVSCGQSETEKNPIISTDFEDMEFPGEPLFVAMIKLKEPALLSTAVRSEEGVYSVDQDLKSRLIEEQALMEAELKRISSDIKVIYSYKMVLNALAVEAPQKFADEIANLNVDFIEADERFAVPTSIQKKSSVQALKASLAEKNSMTFIGVDKVHGNLTVKNGDKGAIPVLGQGVKVGVIDTGIDYTHKMLGGSGDVALYESIDANSSSVHFPNLKVVGGKDFVGATYTPGNHIYRNRIPQPDANPIDRDGHGTHVAGTVAGLGDGVNTYSGAAPGADLYALKVFGDGGGGTSDTVVIAALEYAADPNGDLNPDDKLDVVNLSLGGGFGKPHNLYSVAIENLTNGGILAVAAAGNSGPVSNIVGAPSTAASALSVAASVDDLPQNIEFNAAKFKVEGVEDLFVEALEGGITKPLEDLSALEGELFYIGLASADLSAEQKQGLKGKVALIDRGEVAFSDKLGRALSGGAIGVVMVNNQPGPAIVMGGEGTFDIPGVMVTQTVGESLKRALISAPVTADLKPGEMIRKPQFVDTLASFSSQGPRDLDALIKPEIAAPGQAIISAEAGGGDRGVMLGGTSMASPHMAGVAALLIQYKRNLKPEEVKAILMNTSVLISDEDDSIYPVSRQGAGRVRAFEALTSSLLISRPALSLGKVPVNDVLNKTEFIDVKNVSNELQSYTLVPKNGDNLQIQIKEASFSLQAGESKKIEITSVLSVPNQLDVVEEDAFVEIRSGAQSLGQIPILAVINRNSLISPLALEIKADSAATAFGAPSEASFLNESGHDGAVFLFNLIGEDKRKTESLDRSLSYACDLESAGYKVVNKEDGPHLQIATKIFNPVSSWETCDVNIELDLDSDGVADKIVYGSNPTSFPGLGDNPQLASLGLSTMVFDAQKLSALLLENEKNIAEQGAEPPTLSFLPALEAVSVMLAVEHSTLSIVDIPVAAFGNLNRLQAKIAVSFNGRDVQEREDSLSDVGSVWKGLELKSGAGFTDLPEALVVGSGQIGTAQFKKGRSASEKLVAYFPRNKFNLLRTGGDRQAAVMAADFSSGSPIDLP